MCIEANKLDENAYCIPNSSKLKEWQKVLKGMKKAKHIGWFIHDRVFRCVDNNDKVSYYFVR
jgi:hypothetical protein